MVYQVNGNFGKILPESPIDKEVNESFEIHCVMNLSETRGYNSSALSFYEGNKFIPSQIINDTTIRISITNATFSSTRYTCKIEINNELKGVDVIEVRVGYKPGDIDVNNFKCRSINWQNLTCTFKQMNNSIPTSYDLSFVPNSYSNYWYKCPLTANMDQSYTCTIGPETSYRPSHEVYKFSLFSVNTFANHTQEIKVNQFANIIPEAPTYVTISNITSRQVNVSWAISYHLYAFPKYFIHQINYTSEHDYGVWKVITLQNIKTKASDGYTYHFDNLRYANAWYDIRIRLRCSEALDIDEMWSNYTGTTFKTQPRKPDDPPATDIGSFQINNDDIYVYWIELPLHKRNGDNTEYVIESLDKHKQYTPDTLTNTMARFRGLGEIDRDYVFAISVKNNQGSSERYNKVRIPRLVDRMKEPTNLKKVFHNGTYKLSWLAPQHDQLKDFTIFWCEAKSELPNDCASSINFTHVDKSINEFEFETNKTINFAVSANSYKSSSGMVWVSCTAANSNDIGKLKNFWIVNMHATSMEIKWKPDCTDSTIVEGYNLRYCPISSPKTLDCKETEKTLNITGRTNYLIQNLRPYTTYKTIISMYSKTRIGPPSEALVNATHEDAPTAPRNLVARDVRNASLMLYWDAPEHANGVLMYYEIAFNNFKIRVNNDKREAKEMIYQLTNLSSYTDYKIVVAACTIKCSEASNSIEVKTSIGVPGSMQQPSTIDTNNSRIQLGWTEPSILAGKVDYYELRTVIMKNDVRTYDHITQIAGDLKSCQLKYVICSNDSDKYEFSVRAVNVIPSLHAKLPINDDSATLFMSHISYNKRTDEPIQCKEENDIIGYIRSNDQFAEHLPGEWSKPLTHWCNYSRHQESYAWIIIISVCAILAALTYISCNKIKVMKDITVILPDGLEDVTVKELSKNIENMMNVGKNDQIIICDKSTSAQLKYTITDEQEQSLLKNRGSGSCSTASNSSTCSDSVHNPHDSNTNSLNLAEYPCDNANDDETASVNSLSNESDMNYDNVSFY